MTVTFGSANVTHWQEIEIPEPPKGEREMSNLVEHAKSELALLGNDEMQQSMNEEIIKVIETFSKGGHSGFSAGYAIRAIERLLRFLPLKPLTGEDGEWNHVSDGLYQNKRCGSVFKEDGITYDIGAEIFSDDGGETFYTKGGHRTYIEFPYSPPTHPRYCINRDDWQEKVIATLREWGANHE